MTREAASVDTGERTLAEGRAVLEAGSRCLAALARELGQPFLQAVETILSCKRQLVVTGIGKAGHVATKVSGTFASTGTPSIYLHPADALHGDLGRLGPDDVVLALSNSGTSSEIVRLLQPIRSIGAPIIAVTGAADSPLAAEADVCLCYGKHEEAGLYGLAPTTSTTAMLALGDALAMAVLSRRGFTPTQFARYHPGGALGRSLMRVGEVMRQGEKNPIAMEDRPLFEVLRVMTTTVGRPGAASITNDRGVLTGFYTDGDFRRHMDELVSGKNPSSEIFFLKRPIREIMTRNPKTIRPDQLVGEAVRLLSERKIDQLPVVDENLRPIGLLDVQDLLDVRVLG